MGEGSMRLHFWTRAPGAADPWDPDEEPDRHNDAYGHAFLELYHRMRVKGLPVTLGPTAPRGTTAIMVSFAELSQYLPAPPALFVGRLARAVLALRRRCAVVVIRNDVPFLAKVPGFTTMEIMPTAASVRTAKQRALPLLPQRGIVGRDLARGERLELVAVKAFSYNVPSWLDEEFLRAAERLGYRIRIDDEHSNRWHDFSDVDVVLCTQPEDLEDDRRKPPTKLIAAWTAGVIPVCGDYAGYREIGRDGESMVAAGRDAEGFLSALRRLREQPGLAEGIRTRLAVEADRFSADRIVQAYWETLAEAPGARRRTVFTAMCRSYAAELAGRTRHFIRSARRGA